MSGGWEDDEPVIDDELPVAQRRHAREQEKSKMEQPAPEGAQSRMQQMLRDNMGGMGEVSSGYVGHVAKFGNRIFTERGLFALLFVLLLSWFLYEDSVDDKAQETLNLQLTTTIRAVSVQADEQGEQLEVLSRTLVEMTRELHDANLVRRYSAPQQFQVNPFQNPQEQNDGRYQR